MRPRSKDFALSKCMSCAILTVLLLLGPVAAQVVEGEPLEDSPEGDGDYVDEGEVGGGADVCPPGELCGDQERPGGQSPGGGEPAGESPGESMLGGDEDCPPGEDCAPADGGGECPPGEDCDPETEGDEDCPPGENCDPIADGGDDCPPGEDCGPVDGDEDCPPGENCDPIADGGEDCPPGEDCGPIHGGEDCPPGENCDLIADGGEDCPPGEDCDPIDGGEGCPPGEDCGPIDGGEDCLPGEDCDPIADGGEDCPPGEDCGPVDGGEDCPPGENCAPIAGGGGDCPPGENCDPIADGGEDCPPGEDCVPIDGGEDCPAGENCDPIADGGDDCPPGEGCDPTANGGEDCPPGEDCGPIDGGEDCPPGANCDPVAGGGDDCLPGEDCGPADRADCIPGEDCDPIADGGEDCLPGENCGPAGGGGDCPSGENCPPTNGGGEDCPPGENCDPIDGGDDCLPGEECGPTEGGEDCPPGDENCPPSDGGGVDCPTGEDCTPIGGGDDCPPGENCDPIHGGEGCLPGENCDPIDDGEDCLPGENCGPTEGGEVCPPGQNCDPVSGGNEDCLPGENCPPTDGGGVDCPPGENCDPINGGDDCLPGENCPPTDGGGVDCPRGQNCAPNAGGGDDCPPGESCPPGGDGGGCLPGEDCDAEGPVPSSSFSVSSTATFSNVDIATLNGDAFRQALRTAVASELPGVAVDKVLITAIGNNNAVTFSILVDNESAAVALSSSVAAQRATLFTSMETSYGTVTAVSNPVVNSPSDDCLPGEDDCGLGDGNDDDVDGDDDDGPEEGAPTSPSGGGIEDGPPPKEDDPNFEKLDLTFDDIDEAGSFQDRLVSVSFDNLVSQAEEDKEKKKKSESSGNSCDFDDYYEDDELSDVFDLGGGSSGSGGAVMYVNDINANPVVLQLGLSIVPTAEDDDTDEGDDARRRLQSDGLDQGAVLQEAMVEIVEDVSQQMLEDGFTADNVNVTFSGDGNATMLIRFPLGVPAQVAQLVETRIKSQLSDVEVEVEDEKITVFEALGTVTITYSTAFEIAPDPEATELVLRVVTQLDLKPWMYRDDSGAWTGIVPELIKAIENSARLPSFINFTLSGLDGQYQSRQIQGAVDMIQDGNADIALGPIMISHQSMEVADFSTPFLSTGHILIIPKPETIKPGVRWENFYSFMNPFSWELWLWTMGTIVTAGVVLWMLERDYDSAQDCDFDQRDGKVNNIAKSVWLSVGTFNGALVAHNPLSWLGRLFSASYALFLFIILNSYTANLASYLVTEGAVVYSVESLANAESHNKQVCFIENSLAALMSTYDHPNLRKYLVSTTIEAQGRVNSEIMTDAKTKLLSGQCDGFVVDELLGLFYLESGLGKDTYENSWCSLQQKGGVVLTANYGVAFNRNLPTAVKDVLDEIVVALRDTGAITTIMNKYLLQSSLCPASSTYIPQLSLVDLFGVVMLFWVFFALAILAFGWSTFKRRARKASSEAVRNTDDDDGAMKLCAGGSDVSSSVAESSPVTSLKIHSGRVAPFDNEGIAAKERGR